MRVLAWSIRASMTVKMIIHRSDIIGILPVSFALKPRKLPPQKLMKYWTFQLVLMSRDGFQNHLPQARHCQWEIRFVLLNAENNDRSAIFIHVKENPLSTSSPYRVLTTGCLVVLSVRIQITIHLRFVQFDVREMRRWVFMENASVISWSHAFWAMTCENRAKALPFAVFCGTKWVQREWESKRNVLSEENSRVVIKKLSKNLSTRNWEAVNWKSNCRQ